MKQSSKIIRIVITSDYDSAFFDILNEPRPARSKIFDESNCMVYSQTVRITRKSLPSGYKVQSISKAQLCFDKKNWVVIVDNCTKKIFERFNKYSKRFNIIILTTRVSVDPTINEYQFEDKSNMPSNKYIKNMYGKLAENEYGGNSDPFEYQAKKRKKRSSPLKKQIIPK